MNESVATSWRISSIGNSGARSSGPTGWRVPGCSGGGGGAGRSGTMLYHWDGICDSSRMNLVRSVTATPIAGLHGIQGAARGVAGGAASALPHHTPHAANATSLRGRSRALTGMVGFMSTVPEVSPAVRAALAAGRPGVALESTIISHGLPRPANLAAARSFEQMLTEAGVTAATIAVIDGVPKVGLDGRDLERIALDESVIKVSVRDLGLAMAKRKTAGTTVAATSALAARAGIRVFATGGLGGVHRGFAESLDESADLTVLAATPITIVSAGVKSILDIPATLERLETHGVAVVGYRTSRFPAFYLTDSGQDLDWQLDSPAQIAAVMAARDALGETSALLVANPLPAGRQVDPAGHDRALDGALRAAEAAGIRGKAVTPYLLAHMQRVTEGASVAVNLDVARGNIALAAQVAVAWSASE